MDSTNQTARESFHDAIPSNSRLDVKPPDHENDRPAGHSSSNEPPGQPEPNNPFSVYTKNEKWCIVAMVALAGVFSPMASAIYFPAIPTMAEAFGKSIEIINLTVTVYLIFQGISPMFWGILADRIGRRPVYLMCLSLLVLSSIGLALVPTNAYWLLLVLRCFQATGAASTIALGAGVISDIATPAERGGFLGMFSLGPTAAPGIAPIIGGLLSGNLGWRSIFWFLAIATGVLLTFMALTFPETLRTITGNGSKPPQKWNRTPIPLLGRKASEGNLSNINGSALNTQRRSPSPLQIFRVFAQPDILMILICTGILYSLFYAVITTTSPLFMSRYPFLTQSTVGLCFVAYGVGSAIGSALMGKVLDHDWKKMEARYVQIAAPPSHPGDRPAGLEEGLAGAHTADSIPRPKVDKQDLPIEHTRLRRVPIIFFVLIAACLGYGWSVQAKAHLAVPLVMQFIVGLMSMCIMTVNQTILVDMYPSQGSSITASNNLVRCLLGAATTSIQEIIIKAINPGWTFTLFCGICMLTVPVFIFEWRHGAKWRKNRAERSK